MLRHSWPNLSRLLLLVVVFFMVASAANAEQWLCLAEKAVGFKLNDKSNQWTSASFTNTDKYIIRESTLPNIAYEVFREGEDDPIAKCVTPINSEGYLFCKSSVMEFKINTRNGRFLQIYSSGYYNSRKQTPDTNHHGFKDTPYMEIGKCSPF